ncbi:hypothetical protein [Thiomicrorhabdus sp. 6S3-12]|uniref:hypothetical protein n=1 Tax=Thiomicrorhabdus sp. 6S3-12 TaxID=2819681 RepID=UPI001AACCFDC|nr:hypothetical protein [Thiomicrorhabdus sp. 6S3-12]MBO1923789.1 hypothetical protein [Thiomicrorhabdus sp. 6S3-12]
MKNFFKTKATDQENAHEEASTNEQINSPEHPAAKKTSFLGEKLTGLTERAQNLGSEGLAKLNSHTSQISETLNCKLEAGKTQISIHAECVKQKYSEIDFGTLTDIDSLSTTITTATKTASDNLKRYTLEKLEYNKEVDEVLNEIESNALQSADNMSDIFDRCKEEAAKQAIAVFALGTSIQQHDDTLSRKYQNLSEDYGEFSNRINPRQHENFNNMKKIRAEAQNNGNSLVNGYNSSAPLNPQQADIEHVVSAHEYYNSFLARAGTTDQELINAINDENNLIFADSSVNRSKGQTPLKSYLETNGTPGPGENDITIEINGKSYIVDKNDTDAVGALAEELKNQFQTDALIQFGFDAIKPGFHLAAKQVIGHVVYETHDLFFDEFSAIYNGSVDISAENYSSFAQERAKVFSEKLNTRLTERGVLEKAKKLGMEGFLSGTLSTIPNLLLSMITKLPSMALTIIRECTLSLVRSLKVYLSDSESKLDKIKSILFASVSAVLGIYLTQQIAIALSAIPGVNVFTSEISSVVSSVIVVFTSLVAIYYFDKHKTSIMERFKRADNQNGSFAPA